MRSSCGVIWQKIRVRDQPFTVLAGRKGRARLLMTFSPSPRMRGEGGRRPDEGPGQTLRWSRLCARSGSGNEPDSYFPQPVSRLTHLDLLIKPRLEPICTSAQEGRPRLALHVLLDVTAQLGLHNPIDRLLGPLLGPFHAPPINEKMRQTRSV